MLPKIEFFTSYYLQSKILLVPYNWGELNGFKEKVKEFFDSKSEKILKDIEDFSGIKWDLDYIPVWIFSGWHPSISQPLLVSSYGNDLDFCFFNLVHELIHNNIIKLEIKDDEGEWDLIEVEAIVNFITLNILKDFFPKKRIEELSKFAEFRGYYKYVWLRVEEIKKEVNEEKDLDFKNWLINNPKVKNEIK